MERKPVGGGVGGPHSEGGDLAGKFSAELDAIDSLARDRDALIGDVRRRMDAACDAGALSIKEWRALIEKISAARAGPPLSRPGPRAA